MRKPRSSRTADTDSSTGTNSIASGSSERDARSRIDTQRVFELIGPITETHTFDIEAQGTGTRVKFDTQYDFSNRLLDWITRQIAGEYDTRQFDLMLGILKHHIEMKEVEIEPGAIES